jgi:hypothetical protein
MGSVKIDIDKGARTYAVRYALNDTAGVKKLLRDRHAVSSARFGGDYNAADILIDLHSAINSAGLTDIQTETVAWVSGADLTQRDAARMMDVTQQSVAKTYDAACEKIADVYKRWNYGEVTAEYPLTEEGAA